MGSSPTFIFTKWKISEWLAGTLERCCVERRCGFESRVFRCEDIMKIIFCDVDGVLNNANLLREGGIDTIADSLLAILKKIIISTDAKIVLSSTWRINPDNRRLVREAFARHDMDFIDCTVDLWREDRSIEILEWLHRNPQVEKFAVLDDDPDAGTNGLHDSFFKTSFDVGLTEDIANKIILHLNI